MRAFHVTLLAAIAITASCFSSGRAATLASAEKFAALLVAEVQAAGELHEDNRGRGRAGNAHSTEFSYSIPHASFPVSRLNDAATAALTKWGELESYPARGKGGSTPMPGGAGARFELHFGNDRSHAFVDVLAYSEADQTRIEILIRVLE